MATAKKEPKPGSKAAERAAKRAEKQAEMERRQKALGAEITACKVLTVKPPPAFGDWGVVQVRAWLKQATAVRRWANAVRPNLEKLQEGRKLLERISTNAMPLSELANLLGGPKKK
jgi:hypothetical protein